MSSIAVAAALYFVAVLGVILIQRNDRYMR